MRQFDMLAVTETVAEVSCRRDSETDVFAFASAFAFDGLLPISVHYQLQNHRSLDKGLPA